MLLKYDLKGYTNVYNRLGIFTLLIAHGICAKNITIWTEATDYF